MEIARMLNDMGVEYIELTSAAASKQVSNCFAGSDEDIFLPDLAKQKNLAIDSCDHQPQAFLWL